MFEHTKKLIVKKLIEEISVLDSINIEIVGHNVVSVLENKRLIQRGINKNYKPSGYTVDSFTDDSMIVAEYSTEQGYFDDSASKEDTGYKYKKITKDIKHAVEHSKPNGPTKIYLITSQEEPPSFRSKFNTTKIAQAHGHKIIIYDARELAKLIYEQSVENAGFAGFYRQFFPGLSQDLDNYEYYGRVPAPCERHVSDTAIIDAIGNHFKRRKKICILYGVSGSGKTQAAIDFIHHENTNFENFVWISGEDWKKDTPLTSLHRTRGGTPVNVVGLFKSSKTLLIIDSIERILKPSQFVELEDGFVKGSVVLATSQILDNGNDFYLSIPSLSENVAIQILGENPLSPSENCTELVNLCRFSPLILSTIRNIIESEDISREELYKEVLSEPDEITGKDGKSIIRRILSKLEPKMFESLKQIANSGSSIHDSDFLKHFIGVLNKINLQRLSILSQTNIPGMLKVHDLICIAVQDNLNNTGISTAIERYITKHNGEMSPSVLREIHLCFKQLCEENVSRGLRDPDWLVYALIQVEGDVKKEICDQIYTKEITPDLNLASVMCIIDAKEMHSYTIEDANKRKEYYLDCAQMYQKLFDEFIIDDLRAELLHHQGKSLRRCGKYEEALECFTQLLSLKPDWHATHGQIAHLGTQWTVPKHIKQKGEKSVRKLFQNILQGSSSMPLRVSLAALARLRSYRKVNQEISAKPEEVKKLADIIAMSAFEGFGQFYEAYVSFTSMFGYNHSSICIELAEVFPEILTIPPELVERGQWVSACEALTNTAIASQSEGKEELSNRMKDASIAFADNISTAEHLSSYNARVVAKAYLSINKPQEALDAIEKVSIDDINHWLLYRKSEAQLLIGEFQKALDTAVEAFDLLKNDSRGQAHLPTYYDLKRQCYEKLGNNIAALEEAKLAVQYCSNEKFRILLQESVSRLEAFF